MIRFWLVPVEETATTRGPKYFAYKGDPDAPALLDGVLWESRYYGSEPAMVLAADMDPAQIATLEAQPDVTAFAEDLDTPLGARLATMQAAIEALNLPAQMLTVNTTDRQVIRGIMAIFGVVQCMRGKGFRVFGGAVTLSTTLGSLPVAARTALQECSDAKGYDTSGLTGASTVRQYLTLLVQQSSPSPMMGVTV